MRRANAAFAVATGEPPTRDGLASTRGAHTVPVYAAAGQRNTSPAVLPTSTVHSMRPSRPAPHNSHQPRRCISNASGRGDTQQRATPAGHPRRRAAHHPPVSAEGATRPARPLIAADRPAQRVRPCAPAGQRVLLRDQPLCHATFAQGAPHATRALLLPALVRRGRLVRLPRSRCVLQPKELCTSRPMARSATIVRLLRCR